MKSFCALNLLFLLCCVGLYSCSSDGDSFEVSKDQLKFSSEGGSKAIQVNAHNWSIIRIENKDDNLTIKGTRTLESDKRKEENRELVLADNEYGMLTSNLDHKGFSIERYASGTMEITLDKNLTLHPFSFVIYMKSGGEKKEVTVTQEPSNRYIYKSMEYSLKPGDGESAPYWDEEKSIITTIVSLKNEPSVMTVNPFDYMGASDKDKSLKERLDHSTYTSDDTSAFSFPYVNDFAPDVNFPVGVSDGKLVYSNKMIEYRADDYSNLVDYDFETSKTISVTKIEVMQYHFKFEMKKFIASYTLTLVDSKTNVERKIEGKWTMIRATGKYELVRDN